MRENNSIIKIKFLMNMFEGMVGSGLVNGVEQFKSVVDNMINQGQVEPDIVSIVKRIYGIENTNTFKPSVQSEKVLQIKNTMNYVEQLSAQGYKDNMIKQQLGLLVSNKMLSKTAGDIVGDIYFDTIQAIKPGIKAVKPGIKAVKDTIRIGEATTSQNIYTNTKSIKYLLTGRELTVSELRRLPKSDLLTLYSVYKKLANDNRYRDEVCEYFRHIAYYETAYVDADPCRGGTRYTRKLVNKCPGVPGESKIVYLCDNSDSCAAPSYVPFIRFIKIQLDKIESILKYN